MSTLITRSFQPDLELRASQRIVAGIAVPFGEITDLGYERELFRRGSFERTIRERGDKVKFLGNHNSKVFPLGRATLLREDAAGLYVEARVSKTQAGDEILELISDGTVDGLSVGFKVVRDHYSQPDLREIHEAALYEFSATAFQQYENAKIMSVRHAHTLFEEEKAGRTGSPISITEARSLLENL